MRLYILALTSAALLIISGCKNNATTPTLPGPEWRTYNVGNSRLGSNRIRCILQDFDGSFWIGTDGGLARFVPNANSWNSFPELENIPVTALAQAKDHSIWIGTLGHGVYRYNPQSQIGKVWTNFTNEVPPVISGVAALRTDPSGGYGEVWVSSSSGLDRFDQTGPDDGNWMHFDPTFYANSETQTMTCAYLSLIDDHLWFGASIGGAIEAHYEGNLVWGKYDSPTEQYQVNAVAVDLDNNIWFAKEVGASRLNLMTNAWTYFTSDSTNGQFPGGAVKAIVTDYHTTRWFGTDSGLVLLKDTVYTRFTQQNSSLPYNRITSLYLDLRGNLWIGTQFGLAVYRKGGTLF